jgi:hypothetical protein
VLLARSAGFPARVVTGFRGGHWNSISENYTVRNSDAHAWTEIFDATAGGWRRADALAPPDVQQAGEQTGAVALARRTESGWLARFDSLRVFWYRRIVNFDERSQQEALKTLKTGAQESGRRVREALETAAAALRAWLAGPWDARRIAELAGVIALLAVIVVGWRNFRFSILDFRLWHGGAGGDPVRREAGRWLARFKDAPAAGAENVGVVADLQRLRFGARGTWREPEQTFRRARRAWRTRRRVHQFSPLERGGA